jgi:hypothetical protein
MENPHGNLQLSTWFLVNGSMLKHGIIFEWPKYLKILIKVRSFRQAITIPTISNQYYGKSMWKFANFHMIFGK